MFVSINPATGKMIRSIEFDDNSSLNHKLEQAQITFQNWKKIPLAERCQLVLNLSDILLKNIDSYCLLMAEEMGKPISAGKAEIEKSAWLCRHYAENAENYLQNEAVDTQAQKSYISYEPMGVLMAVMPWNFPFWQVMRFAIPNILAGNIIALKHAPNVLGCCVAIDDMFFEAGFPEDVLVPLYIDIPQMENAISNDIIKGVSLTGSVEAGRSIAQLAAKHLKKSVLELGGSDPFVILEDADIEYAAKTCAIGRIRNSGQSCIGPKRMIVVQKVYNEFIEQFKNEFEKGILGNPMDEATQIGPIARIDLRDILHEQVEKSLHLGAKALIGAFVPDKAGAWYPLTILTDVKKGMPAYNEELFGPVAVIIQAKDEEEALQIANDTSFGLGASVFTNDIEKGEDIAKNHFEAGACFVNELVKSDPRLPFGGIKNSGYGRELSHFGMKEFCNIKTIWIK